MKNIMLSFCFIVAMFTHVTLVSAQDAAKDDSLQLVLSLHQKSGDKVTSKIDFYANEINPNISSVRDKWLVKKDGKPVFVPERLMRKINYMRRSYSYDSLSGGIQKHSKPQIMCMMGGESAGAVLYTRYLEFDQQSFQIIKSAMKPVYSDAYNCLFTERYYPENENAKLDAARAMAILQTIQAYSDTRAEQ